MPITFLVEGGNVFRVDADDAKKRRVGRIPLAVDGVVVVVVGFLSKYNRPY